MNNNLAIQEVYKQVGFYGVMFEGKYRFTKQQVADYFDVDIRTIERVVEANKEELKESGYEVYSGMRLKRFKDSIGNYLQAAGQDDVPDMIVGSIMQPSDNKLDSILKTSQLVVFTYKAFLNTGMLLTGSEKAQKLRSAILDIVIDVLNQRLGGKTKYINQREEEFLPSAIREYSCRKEFTNALDYYIVENKFKYAQLTDKIYKSIFRENAKEYRQILQLGGKDEILSFPPRGN